MKRLNYPDFVDAHFGNVISQIEDSGRVVCITLLFSLFTIAPVGYHIVALNVPEKIVQKHINESFTLVFNAPFDHRSMSIFWSVTIACQSIGALIGCMLVVPLSTHLGAKRVLAGVNNYILLSASLCFAIDYLFSFAPFLIVGRLLAGVFTGIGCAFLPLYVQEVAPKEIKGSLSCFMHMAVCLGAAASAVISLPFFLGGEETWWIHLALPGIFAIGLLIVGGIVPDTPNHLIQNGHYRKALESIKFYYDISVDDEDEAIRQYWDRMSPQMSLFDAFADPRIRWGIIIGMVVSATQIFSGSMATISYSTSMFTSVSFLTSLIPYLPALGSIVSVLLTLPALQLVETSGRRPLLLKTLLICLVADVMFLVFTLLAVNPEDWWASWMFGLAFLIYGVGYNLGTGPVAYFIPSELVPVEAASVSLGAAVATNWFSTIVTTVSYYPLQQAFGGWSYLLFIIPSLIFLIFLWRYLPETKYYFREGDEFGKEGRSITELSTLLTYGTFLGRDHERDEDQNTHTDSV